MKKRIGKQEILAAVLIIGSAAWYWYSPSPPRIVFAGEQPIQQQDASADD